MTKAVRARVITPDELRELRYELPKSWTRAAGLLRSKRALLERHLKRVRREWDRRSARV